MPRYEFHCPKCGWSGERITKLAERDDQTCENMAGVGVDDANPPPAGAPDNATVWSVCGCLLSREEISLNAKMAHMWQVN